jgi:hypothetical protein
VATLTDCDVSDNEAGSIHDEQKGVPVGSTGGIAAGNRAHLTLQDTRVVGNKAAMGGGMVISPDAQLLLLGNTKITGNEAWERAGGVNMLSNGLVGSWEQLEAATRGNVAPHDPDIALPINELQVLGTSSSSGYSTKEEFIPGDVLLLNVSIAGPGGRQSNQTVTVLFVDARNVSIFTDRLRPNISNGQQAVTTARVMIMQPPGAFERRSAPVDKGCFDACTCIRLVGFVNVCCCCAEPCCCCLLAGTALALCSTGSLHRVGITQLVCTMS